MPINTQELQDVLESQDVAPEVQEQTTDTQPEVTQEVAPVQKSFKELFTEKGYDVSDLDDASLADQLAQRLASQQQLEQELAELRQVKAEMERLALESQRSTPTPAPAQVEEATKSVSKELKRWQKVDLDPELKVACEYDPENRIWRGKDKFGSVGFEAARKLNESEREQQRRAQLMINDPIAAMEEAGLLDIIEERLSNRTSKVQEEVLRKFEEERQRSTESQRQASRNQEADRFFEENKAKLFQLNESGLPKKGLDNQFLLTEFGKQVRDVSSQLQADGISDPAIALRRATEICSRFQSATPQEKPVDKKEAFLNKSRQASVEAAKSPAPIQAKPDGVAVTPGRRKFLEYALSDPDNAEALGEYYRGN